MQLLDDLDAEQLSHCGCLLPAIGAKDVGGHGELYNAQLVRGRGLSEVLSSPTFVVQAIHLIGHPLKPHGYTGRCVDQMDHPLGLQADAEHAIRSMTGHSQ